MPKYFFSSGDKTGDTITLRGETAHHLLHVLRLKSGAEVILCDGACIDYTAALSCYTKETCTFEVTAQNPCTTEPPYALTVYQAHPKGDKIESVIQKSVELGATKIVPLYTAHTLAKNIEKKQPRYQKIAHAAAAQCNRGILPEVTLPTRFADAVAEGRGKAESLWVVALSPSEVPLAEGSSLPSLATLARQLSAASQASGDSVVKFNDSVLKSDDLEMIAGKSIYCVSSTSYRPPASVGIWVGPEGGFSREEVRDLLAAGAHGVSLGARVLRTETAAPALLAQVALLWEAY